MPCGELLEGWLQRARAALGELEEATSPTEAHRLRVELIDSVGALVGIESLIASHVRARTRLDPAQRAGRARLRLALLCIASSAPWERRHHRALSTIRAALWERTPMASVRWSAELSRVVTSYWPLGRWPLT